MSWSDNKPREHKGSFLPAFIAAFIVTAVLALAVYYIATAGLGLG